MIRDLLDRVMPMTEELEILRQMRGEEMQFRHYGIVFETEFVGPPSQADLAKEEHSREMGRRVLAGQNRSPKWQAHLAKCEAMRIAAAERREFKKQTKVFGRSTKPSAWEMICG